MSAKRFYLIILVITLILLSINASFNWYMDPYWAYHPTTQYKNSSVLDHKQRFAKALQVLFFKPDVIFIGSSRVYKGIDPKEFSFLGNKIYNFGISSLTIEEMYQYVNYMITFTPVNTVVAGLDFWMIDDNVKYNEGFDTYTGNAQYPVNLIFSSLLSLEALQDSIKSMSETPSMTNSWSKSGYYSSELKKLKPINDAHQAYIKYFSTVTPNLIKLQFLEKIIQLCKLKGVKLILYISPHHPQIIKAYKETNALKLFTKWRKEINRISIKNDILLFDFSQDYLHTSLELTASTKQWIDYSHFGPEICSDIADKMRKTIQSEED